MDNLFRNTALNSYFLVTDNFPAALNHIESKNLIHIVWNRSHSTIDMVIDGVPLDFGPGFITTLTYLHKFKMSEGQLYSFSFNREFYCINDHDHEISCNGLLFFGTTEPPIVKLDETETVKYEALFQVFIDEFSTKDNIQEEMLRMLLKRLIIKTTRLVKQQLLSPSLNESQIDIIRRYHVLVEINFKKHHRVSDYAGMLFRSPKTLSNLFSTYKQKTPLRIIHDRLILEAKRQLLHTDKSAKEIAYELGFDSDSSFSKFFKRHVQTTPSQFKTSITEG